MKINKKLSNEVMDVWECDCGTDMPVKKGSTKPQCEYCRRVKERTIKNKDGTYKTKVQMMWEISKEQEELFRKGIPQIVNGIDTEELFKMIRGSEYRRGKDELVNEIRKLIKERKLLEADFQSGEIEFSYTGELIPIELLEDLMENQHCVDCGALVYYKDGSIRCAVCERELEELSE